MRLLFIDFDGVLHPSNAISIETGRFCCLHLLHALLKPHEDVGLVVHSSWRYDHTDGELMQLLGPVGAWFSGSAPRMRREQTIPTVLQSNKGTLKAYLVTDDDQEEIVGTSLNVLFCDPTRGISDDEAQA